MIIYRHSDDLGITIANSNAILDAWENKYIDGFSIVANTNTQAYIKKRILENIMLPARIGVHLNLSDGICLAAKKNIPLLVDGSGRLKIYFFKALWIHIIGGNRKSEFLQQVKVEWTHQIEKVIDCIPQRSITFLDSHYHIHMIPSLFKLATELCTVYNIPQVRRTKEFFYFSDKRRDNFSIHFFKNIIKHFLLNFLSGLNKISSPIVCSADFIAGVLFSGQMNKEVIKQIIATAKKNKIYSTEIIFHIGFTDVKSLKAWTNNKHTIKHYSSMGPAKEWEAVKEVYYGR